MTYFFLNIQIKIKIENVFGQIENDFVVKIILLTRPRCTFDINGLYNLLNN